MKTANKFLVVRLLLIHSLYHLIFLQNYGGHQSIQGTPLIDHSQLSYPLYVFSLDVLKTELTVL